MLHTTTTAALTITTTAALPTTAAWTATTAAAVVASPAVPTCMRLLPLRLLLLEEVRVVLELRWVMHVVWVLPLPRLPLLSLMRQLRVVLRLVPLCDRVVLLVPVLRLLHVVRHPRVFVDLERLPSPLRVANLGRSLLVARAVVLQKRRL